MRAIAPNATAMQNGRALSVRFLTRFIAEDRFFLFGSCPGSDNIVYTASADFSALETPVYRCSCPSRQKPCKHVLGLLLAYVGAAEQFSAAPIPAELASPVRKTGTRRRTAAPGRRDTQKLTLQIEGLSIALGLAESIVREGLGTLSVKRLNELRTQCRALGNCHLPGVQVQFTRILRLLSDGLTEDAPRRAAFTELAVFAMLCRRALTYFEQKKSSAAELDAELESWCGRVWYLTELEEMGLCLENTRLIQLAFTSIDNPDSGMLEDTGYWVRFDATSAEDALCLTQTLRPREALARVREDDSCFGVASVPKLYRYPAGLRVRWDEFSLCDPTPGDFETLLALSEPLAPAVKRLRRNLQSLCAPRVLPAMIRLGALETDGSNGFWLRDTEGALLPLDDAPDAPASLLPLALDASHKAVFLLLTARPDGQIAGQCLSLLSPDGVTRLGG